MSELHDSMSLFCKGWTGKFEKGWESKKEFTDVGDQCTQFFQNATDFMWQPKYTGRFMGGGVKSRFKVTIAKAFELVALYGPVLAWSSPHREIKPRKMLEFDFGQEEEQDQLAMMVQQTTQMDAGQKREREMRSEIWKQYLNYTPTEQPGGGLQRHAELAVSESLVTGMGCLWPEPYEMPGDPRRLTGCFFDTCDNLLIDPDTETFTGTIDDAWWIARKCTHPTWWVEREYKLPFGSLKGKGNKKSQNAEGSQDGNPLRNLHDKEGRTQDLITYYKVWSRMGLGHRMTGMNVDLKKRFDEVVGDYAYIVVAPGVDFPLNGHPDFLAEADEEQVKEAFSWPIPFYKDKRWPVCILSYYDRRRDPWPIAPMSQGLGELIALNVITSAWLEQIWNQKDPIIGTAKSAAAKLRKMLKQGDWPKIVEVEDGVQESLKGIIEILEFPSAKNDILAAMDWLVNSFERRTGINDLLQGLLPGNKAMRSAAEANTRNDAAQVRPDYMYRQVEKFHEESARMERFVAKWHVEGEDLRGIFTPGGQFWWDRLIVSQDVETVLRESDVTIAAGSGRKPNKQRDAENMQTLNQTLLPVLDKHADTTGDTAPLNSYIDMWGDSNQQEVAKLKMGPRVPQPPSPEEAQAQQEMQQLEAAKLEAEVEKTRLEAQAKQMEMQQTGEDMQAEMQKRQMELQFEQVQKAHELEFSEAQHETELEQTDETHGQKLQQSREEFLQSLIQKREESQLKLQQMEAEGEVKIGLMKRQPKPQTNGSSSK